MRLLALLALAFAAMAANVRIYLKDGNYQLAREYKVESDRVRFYSVERSEWEEIPLSLVDLKRTESEVSARQEKLDQEAKVIAAEETAEREMQKEVSRIPQDPGVYWVEGDQTRTLKQAEATVRTSKGRSVLKRLAPIPVVAGKGSLEIKGEQSATVLANRTPEFYVQLSEIEQFGIAKLTPKGGVRIVENITYMPVTNEVIEEPQMAQILQRELANGLYKIWPREPLSPGEYAVIEFTAGKLNMQVWDFAVK